MTFETLSKPELLQAADQFGVDVDLGVNGKGGDTRPQIIAKLAVDGVTWDLYKRDFPDVEDQPDAEEEEDVPVPVKAKAKVVPTGPLVLLKMTRANPTYEVRGYRFTRENPFLPVTEEAADWILENIEGFSIASPAAAREFYS